jgi:hypothetical protein
MSRSTRIIWWLLIIGLTIVFDLIILRIWRGYRQQLESQKGKDKDINRYSLLIKVIMEEIFRKFWVKCKDFLQNKPEVRNRLFITFELLLIALWAIYVGREYLNFNPRVIPAGREFLSAIQTHHMWTRFQNCGWCAVWNNTVRGGYPMFVDVHGSMLHPIVIITTLVWGVINGAKVALVISLWMAGVAQWWLAKEMRLGWLPRLWSAGIAVVGGHLTGRMELGVFGVVLSTAMSSLVFCGILYVARGGGKRAAVLLGILMASALVSGQGYIQVGLAGTLPALIFLLLDNNRKISPIWKDFILAMVLAFLLAAPFLVSFIHFSPNFVKDVDPEFKTAQPLVYLPLNLVIGDWEFLNSDLLEKLPYPHLYTLFIGWIPVILAILGLSKPNKDHKHYFLFFSTVIVIEFLIGSAVLLRWVAKIFPGIAGVRHPSQITGLAVPIILVFAAYGLEYLINLPWPTLLVEFSESLIKINWKIPLRWILLFPIVFSLREGYQFSKMWIYTEPQDSGIYELVDDLDTTSLQWVNTPFGEHQYIEYAVREDLKLSPGIMSWNWEGREHPIPVLEANRAGPPSDDSEQVGEVTGVPIYKRTDQHYAAIVKGESMEPCAATGSGGRITIVCNTTFPGQLVVKENTWTGWKAWVDGERIPLTGDQWLEVNALAGKHIYEFRYRPWDVPLGLFLSLTGILLCITLWRHKPKIGSEPKVDASMS